MPSMANITVKKNDGTTDIVFTALSPSGGDKVPAIWRSETAGSQASVKPTLKLMTSDNGPSTARVANAEFVYPYAVTNSTTGVTSVIHRVPIKLSGTFPKEVPDSIINEAVSQAMNLFVSVLFKDSLKAGVAPT